MQFFAVFVEILALLLSVGAALIGGYSLKKSVHTKNNLVRLSRGSILLQQSALKILEDGNLSKDEIDDFAEELEEALKEYDGTKVMKQRMRRMLKQAVLHSSSRRLLQEIIFEVLDETKKTQQKVKDE